MGAGLIDVDEALDLPEALARLLERRPPSGPDLVAGLRSEILLASEIYHLASRAGLVEGFGADHDEPRGKVYVRCPGEREHTNATRGTHAALVVGRDGSVYFHCHHESCRPTLGTRLDDLRSQATTILAKREAEQEAEEEEAEVAQREREEAEELERLEEPQEEPQELEEYRGWVRIDKLTSPAEEDYWWRGFVHPGRIWILHAPPKAGKTTFLTHLIKAWGTGAESFCGAPTSPARVLLASEEDARNWVQRCEDLDLAERNLWVNCRPQVATGVWPLFEDFIATNVEAASRLRCNVVVFDTATALSPVVNENDNVEMTRLVRAFERLTAEGIAVVLCAHTRKNVEASTGLDSLRGASAFAGAADVITSMRAVDERRVLTSTGRLLEILEQVTVVLQDGAYVEVSKPTMASHYRDKTAAVLEIIPSQDHAATRDEICAALRGRVGARSVKSILSDLALGGSIQCRDGRYFR